MIVHSQYFTEDIFADSLVNLIPECKAELVLDLGIGNGALSNAIIKRWNNATVDAVDIDPDICSQYNNTIGTQIHVQQGDVLSLCGIDHLLHNQYDLAVCNPPYHKIKRISNYDCLFEQSNLSGFLKLKKLTAEVIFIAQNIKLIKHKGLLIVILPDGLITRHDFASFRETLLSNYQICHIIQFPDRAFNKTEARTHALIISKSKPVGDCLPISLLNDEGNVVDTIQVRKEDLLFRMDYSFHKWETKYEINKRIRGNSNVIIKRGNISYKELRAQGIPFIHSNSYNDHDVLIKREFNSSELTAKTAAHSGDFII